MASVQPFYQCSWCLCSVFFITLFLLVDHITCTKFPKEWCQCHRDYCASAERNIQLPTTITATPTIDGLASSGERFLMPPFILWSPLEQFPFVYHCPKCLPKSNVDLRPIRWQDGSNQQSTPRKIHGINGPILLLGRVYKCINGHEVLAYHPGLIDQVPIQESVPFALWYRTGFTCDLVDLVHSLVIVGVSISAITETLQRNRYKFYFQMRSLYHAMHTYLHAPELPFPSVEEYEEILGAELTPSRHSTSSIFLVSFSKKEKIYVNEMRRTSVDNDDGWLSCDHTFASVSEL